ncbi:hypothetical protein [Micromonospora sp. WMMD737]|uniref:hypothetical protein n=1 Tax=Micromonospora sp. WMMD737 TaxID=3404113 RepID=UPI003B952291
MANSPPGTPEDDGPRPELAAFDVETGAENEETDLGVILGDFRRAPDSGEPDDHPDQLAGLMPPDRAADPQVADATPLFTVTNPDKTVSVTTYLDGRVQRIELGPGAGNLTASELADEIVCIAGLATQDARSAQYTVMLDGMREHGHHDAATRDFLNRDLDLPTPEQAAAARIELFSTRYAGEND